MQRNFSCQVFNFCISSAAIINYLNENGYKFHIPLFPIWRMYERIHIIQIKRET